MRNFINFKVGVRKISTTFLVVYNLPKKGYKIFENALMLVINEGKDINDVILRLFNDLDLAPNVVDFSV